MTTPTSPMEAVKLLREAAGKLIKAKGRFHTEQNYAELIKVYEATAAIEQPASEAVAWAAESNIGGGIHVLTKFAATEAEIDRYVSAEQARIAGCDRVKVALGRIAPPALPPVKPAGAPVEACKERHHMHPHACDNRHQCWEPCGELGKSAEHAKRAPQHVTDAVNSLRAGAPVDERAVEMPTLPQSLINLIGEYGMARTDRVGEPEIQHRWLAVIAGIKDYAHAALQQPGLADKEKTS